MSELGGWVEVGFLDVAEVAVGLHLELGTSGVVGHDDGRRMELQGRDGPHLRYTTFDTVAQGAGLVVAVDQQEHRAGVHHCADAYGKGGLGHEVDVALEEAGVGDDGVGGEGLDAGTRRERGAGLVEGDMSVGTHTAHEEVNTSVAVDFLLEAAAFGLKVGGVAVEDVDVFAGNVDVVEEIVPHEAVVALRMVLGKTHIFIHIEGDDVAKRHIPFLVKLDELAVEPER